MTGHLVAAEWLKLRTTPLLWATVPAVALLAAVALGGLVLSAELAGVALLEPTDHVRQAAFHLTTTGAALIVVIGIVISAGEYRTRTAVDSFLTTPRRGRVLAAKLVFAGTLGLALGAAGAAIAAPVAFLLFESEGLAFPTGDLDVWLVLAGVAASSALYAILGVAFGSLVRNQVVAVVAALVGILLVEQLLTQSGLGIADWLPGSAGAAVVRAPGDFLAPGAGAAVLAAYSLVLAAAGLVAITRRDA